LTIYILRTGENIGEMKFYFKVVNVDKFWASIKDKIKEPFDRENGMREIHIKISHMQTLLYIG